jgi:hypothetical protein
MLLTRHRWSIHAVCGGSGVRGPPQLAVPE